MDTGRCPNAYGHWPGRPDSKPRPKGCGRLGCGYCGPRRALSTANAIAMAAPHWAGVLTSWGKDLPVEPSELFALFARATSAVVAGLRSAGAVEYCWVLELSSRRIPNVHVLMWGDPLERSTFHSTALQAGMRWGDVQPIRHVGVMARYVLKLPLSPLDLGLDGESCMNLHLQLNGGRLVHSSRRFWRDREGHALPGLRVARSEARRQRPGTGQPPSPSELARRRAGWNLPPLST